MSVPLLAALVALVAAVLAGRWYVGSAGRGSDGSGSRSSGDGRAAEFVCPHYGTANALAQVHCRGCQRTVSPLAWHHHR
jgi:hypothetical protein